MTSTIDTTDLAAQFFQDYSLDISYIEDFGDVGNIEKPLARNLVQGMQLRFHSEKTAYLRQEFSQIQIDTESGWFKKFTETVSGIFFRTNYENYSDRFPLDEYEPLVEGFREAPVRYGYAYIKLQLSNQT